MRAPASEAEEAARDEFVVPPRDDDPVEDLYIPAAIFDTPEQVMEDAARRPNAPGRLHRLQAEYLMRPIAPNRVQTKDRSSYVEGHDVIAHLTRIFGYGNWNREVRMLEQAGAWRAKVDSDGREFTGERGGYCAVYRSTCRLTVKDIAGRVMSTHEDSGTFEALNQSTPGAAHDLALKGAVSTALKRAARDWGDQFGLSLYYKGMLNACITWSLGVPPPDPATPAPSVESMHTPDAAPDEGDTPATVTSSDPGYF